MKELMACNILAFSEEETNYDILMVIASTQISFFLSVKQLLAYPKQKTTETSYIFGAYSLCNYEQMYT